MAIQYNNGVDHLISIQLMNSCEHSILEYYLHADAKQVIYHTERLIWRHMMSKNRDS